MEVYLNLKPAALIFYYIAISNFIYCNSNQQSS